MNRIACLGFALALLSVAAGTDTAKAQTANPPVGVSTPASTLSPVDYNFVAQANLGAPFQIDSGRVAEKKATTANIRDYVQGQVDYQQGNAALFRYEIQNGIDPDLREFARHTLPKIEDHLQRALTLAKSGEFHTNSSE